jgi:hypothetical protein
MGASSPTSSTAARPALMKRAILMMHHSLSCSLQNKKATSGAVGQDARDCRLYEAI